MSSMHKRLQEVKDVLIEEGFTVIRHQVKGHIKLWAEIGGKVQMFVAPGTPGSHRNIHNFRSVVRRAGRAISGGGHG